MTDNDQWIPGSRPLDRLAQMPHLAAQAVLLGQTRNPDGDPRALHPHTSGSRPAARLDRVDVADDTTEARGSLRALILWCSRPIWESLDADTRAMHPQPDGAPTWVAECAWLDDVWTDSRAHLDEVDMDMVDMTLADVYADLCRAVGLSSPRSIRCPTCGADCDLEGDVLVCTETRGLPWVHEFPGPAAIRRRWRHHPPMETADLCDQLPGMTPGKLRQWHWRRRIKPARTEDTGPRTRHSWWPWDVIGLLWPDIAEAVEKDEGDVTGSSERAS